MSTTVSITVEEFDRMLRSGVFESEPHRRIELIEGELREMSPPPDPDHEYVVDLLNRWSFLTLPPQGVLVRVQNSLGIPELDSVPLPDLTWVVNRDYRKRRPTAADVLLVIEVAKSSLRDDLGRKSKLYAKAGISDYWIINIVAETIEVRRKPVQDRFTRSTIHNAGQKIRPLAFPKLTLDVESLFHE